MSGQYITTICDVDVVATLSTVVIYRKGLRQYRHQLQSMTPSVTVAFETDLTLKRKMPMVFPHELVAWLVDNGLWNDSEKDRRETARFWDHFRGLKIDWATRHPATSSHRPLGIYGDDARYTEQGQKFLGVHMNDVLEDGKDSMRNNWPIWVLRCATRQISHNQFICSSYMCLVALVNVGYPKPLILT